MRAFYPLITSAAQSITGLQNIRFKPSLLFKVLASATGLALLFSIHVFYVDEDLTPWRLHFLNYALEWYLWAALFFFLLPLVKRYPIMPGNLGRLWIHISLAFPLTLIRFFCYLSFWNLLLPYDSDQYFEYNSLNIWPHVLWGHTIYFAMLAVCHLIVFYESTVREKKRTLEIQKDIDQSSLELLKNEIKPRELIHFFGELRRAFKIDPQIAELRIAEMSETLRNRLIRATRLLSPPAPIEFAADGIDSTLVVNSDARMVRLNTFRSQLFGSLGAFLLVGALETFAHLMDTGRLAWGRQLFWLYWALFTPILIRLTLKKPLKKDKPRILFHVMLNLAGVLGQFAIFFVLFKNIHPVKSGPELIFHTLRFSFTPMTIFVYWSIVGMIYSLLYLNEMKSKEMSRLRLESNLASARLEALKMQLHPHFLFNALNSLSEMLYHNIAAAQKMLDRLEDFFQRAFQDSNSGLVAFEQELKSVQDYLAIEDIRFQEKLQVSLNIAEATLSHRVPHLLLLPVVENCIRHAINRVETGRIQIKASLKDSILSIAIQDNGPGIPDGLQPLQEGLGLAITRSRLQSIYGSLADLQTQNLTGHGFAVHISIPQDPR